MDERTEVVGMNEIVGDEVSTENTGKVGFRKPLMVLGAIGGVVAGALGIRALINKTKDKRKAKKIAKEAKHLESEGWTLMPPIDDNVVEE